MNTIKLIGEHLIAGVLLISFAICLVMLTSTDDSIVLTGAVGLIILICLCLVGRLIIELVERRYSDGI